MATSRRAIHTVYFASLIVTTVSRRFYSHSKFLNMELININIANVVFNCPYCNLEYNDCDDNYVDRCNKNKSKCTSVKCGCGNKFYMTYNFKGDAVSFKRESTLNAY